MPLRRFRRQYEQLSQFERERIIGMMQGEWSSRRVARQLGHSDCVVRRCWGQWIRESDESRFNRVCVWKTRGERLNPVFALQQHTAPTAGMMVWNAIAYNTRLPLVLIRGTMTAQRYVHDILQPHALPLMQRLPGAIFQQDNARPHTARVSQGCLLAVTFLPSPARSPDLSSIDHIWDLLGWRVGHPMSLNELKARLQQTWSETSQDII
ncbi:transposable element Tcb2 transposase [Trichonephila clavipes]|uniref:Transposable element Tcb2 transposase n=1 Tax=Trichonephila clavipes TaxID=2585209 RepID=A0A8X6SL57_TRICX|nr:transposable element Tcb2 transposase [Trichonephila clavipes]